MLIIFPMVSKKNSPERRAREIIMNQNNFLEFVNEFGDTMRYSIVTPLEVRFRGVYDQDSSELLEEEKEEDHLYYGHNKHGIGVVFVDLKEIWVLNGKGELFFLKRESSFEEEPPVFRKVRATKATLISLMLRARQIRRIHDTVVYNCFHGY
jgi:hypothetical protein